MYTVYRHSKSSCTCGKLEFKKIKENGEQQSLIGDRKCGCKFLQTKTRDWVSSCIILKIHCITTLQSKGVPQFYGLFYAMGMCYYRVCNTHNIIITHRCCSNS